MQRIALCRRLLLTPPSHTRRGETCRARRVALAQVVPPGEAEAGRVEGEVDHERQMRAPGDGNRCAEAARDQIAAAGADRADEAERGRAFDAGRRHGPLAALLPR